MNKHKLLCKKIGFLGPEGSFSHQAAIQFSKRLEKIHKNECKVEFSPLSSIFACVENLKELSYSVIPIENSTNGQVMFSYDLLRDYCNRTEETFRVIAEEFVPIHHNLLTGAKNLREVEVIYSHPQVWSQCSDFFKNLNITYTKIDTDSTSKAAQLVSEDIKKGKVKSAAICNKVAAKIYNIDILQANIEDNKENTTRFLVLKNIQQDNSAILADITNKKIVPDITEMNHNNELTLISITSQNPCLFDVFYEYKLRIRTIISRPSHRGNWNYMFFIEYYNNSEEALQKLKQMSSQLTVLGSFNKVL